MEDWREDHQQYRKLHILFTAALDRRIMSTISANKILLKHLARHSFKEFYLQLHIISDNALHFMIPSLTLSFSADSQS